MEIQVDSRKVKKGDTFVALRGVSSDGHSYIEKAIENGASMIVAEEGSYSIPTKIVPNTREYLIHYLETTYQNVIQSLKFIGITGTNGKTTSAFLLHNALSKVGKKAAYIGTVGFYIGGEKVKSLNNTTPDVLDLFELFLEAYQSGCTYIVQEISSQGLSYHRVEGYQFDYAIFTNLTQDHLDFHHTMENYALAKQELFHKLKPTGRALINIDDAYHTYYLLKENHNMTYGFNRSDYQVTGYVMSQKGTKIELTYQENKYHFDIQLLGRYNVYNMLITIMVLHEENVLFDDIIHIVHELTAPVGRMEVIPYHNNSIIIDYAHTPDALEKIIQTMKEITKGHIYVVFGCTGDRDKGKRPIMASLATSLCDYAIFTSDDPHSEDPILIIEEMAHDLTGVNYEKCPDRKKAIERGIELLKENDTLLILGKGHEEVMIVKDKKIPFNDRHIVENYLKSHNSVTN